MSKRILSILSGLAVAAALIAPAHAKPAAAAKSSAAHPAKKGKKKLTPPVKLAAEEIVARNLAARGGESAWRSVNGLTMSGEMDAGGKENPKLPFVLSLARPHRSRLELKFADQTAVQVWDGKQGWKVRPYLNRNEVESFTAAETRAAAAEDELDGPLLDAGRKGTKVELAGTEVVEGRYTYKLRLTAQDGRKRNLWIDSTTFLEAKIDGEPRKLDNRMHKVAIYFRDFKTIAGLSVPHTLETAVEGVKPSHKMTIQAVTVNPKLPDSLFTKPQLGLARLAP